MRTLKKIHQAVYEPIADLVTYRALPTNSIDQVDPFLFLNHHGFQAYQALNHGLPFGPHPHRGFETVTFILHGDLAHKDSGGAESVIGAGGVQWMTAGRGLIHSENSSKEFLEKGGGLEILQLWVNLPARLKMVDPGYTGLQNKDIPAIATDGGNVTIKAVSGKWEGIDGAFKPIVDIQLAMLYFKPGGKILIAVPPERNIFFYVVKGKLQVQDQPVTMHQLATFNNDGEDIEMVAPEESILLMGHALPFNETVVAQGPFVMNTQLEIKQAYEDYRRGLFGTWKS